jgi:predicted nucleic acid-binding protein
VIVVDTSVLVSFFRGRGSQEVSALRQIELDRTPFAIPAVCCQELLQGAGSAREWRLLLEYLETQTLLFPADPWHAHVEAARIFFDCRRKGITVRSSIDCFIAQLVLEVDGTLLHADADYERIKAVRPLRTWSGDGATG